ncbi:flagellar filament capping protein FliD [Paenibacillus sp. BAC0078]
MVTRVNGFSGMDIDSMVKSMMAAKRVPLDTLNQNKQILNWTREGYRELNSKLYDFRQNKLISTTKYGGSAALNANKAVVTGNTDAVKAEAQANAAGIDMKVSVTQLATRTSLTMKDGLGQGVSSSTSLAKLDGVDLSLLSDASRTEYLKKGFDVTINGENFKDADGNSLFNGLTSISTMVSTINSNAKANAIASYDELTGKLTIASKTSGDPKLATAAYDVKKDLTIGSGSTLLALFTKRTVTEVETNGPGITDGTKSLAFLQNKLDGTKLEDAEKLTYQFSVNNKWFAFDAKMTIDEMVTKINDETGTTGVQAQFTGGKLKLSAASGEVKLGGNAYDLLKLFNGVKPAVSDPSDFDPKVAGQDAKVNINGVDLKDTSSNIITINGVQLTLLETTNKSGTDVPFTIKTQTDPDKAVETINAFVEDYNELIKTLNAKVDEIKYRDFKPLTDDQKKAMTDDDIKTWTERAKSGLFKNNDILNSVLAEMRSVITEKLGSLSTLGITTGNYLENGKLVVNQQKLKDAVNANPQLAMDLFQGPANAPKEGIFDKLADKIGSALDKISERAGTNKFSMDLSSSFKSESVMGKKLKEYDNKIYLMQKNLNEAENRYYKQFTAMETAMNKMQSQTSKLFQ